MERAPTDPVRPGAGGAVDVTPDDLRGPGVVFCPNPKMPLWSHHPRVFLEVGANGEAKCPYCSTVYRLSGGARPVGGH